MRTILAAAMLAAGPARAAGVQAAAGGEAALLRAFSGLSRAVAEAPRGGCSVQPDDSAWGRLVRRVCAEGGFTAGDGMVPATRGLAKLQGPREATHLADYVNLWGAADSRETLYPGEATFVSENWVLGEDKLWRIDQWIFKLGMDGAVYQVYHGFLVENLDGRVLDSGSYPDDGLDSPAAKAKHAALLALWAAP